jgi:hypothetical protein
MERLSKPVADQIVPSTATINRVHRTRPGSGTPGFPIRSRRLQDSLARGRVACADASATSRRFSFAVELHKANTSSALVGSLFGW